MKIKLSLAIPALLIAAIAMAQKPEQQLSSLAEKAPIEKVYLQFDRNNYIGGQTAWFKAYLYSDYLPDTISTSLYVELVTDKNKVITRSIVPILLGTANGYIELADSLITGYYLIRTYTATMLNHDAGFIGRQSIFIYGKKNTSVVTETKDKVARIEFFPEGGNLVTGFSNTVAFKATTENGLPVEVKGKLLNEKNELLASFSSYHDGMGMFQITPGAGEKYCLQLEDDPVEKKYYLPEQTTKGIAISIIPHPQGNFFELSQQKDDPAFQVSYMIGQMQHHVVFKQDFKTIKQEMQGVINTQNLHSGILQVTFFNKYDQPLAERLCFVNNKEYIQQGELIADTVSFSAKGRNRLSIQLKDTVQGNFSVSVTDPEYDITPMREENIFSNLLLTADLKGYIHNPAFYFSADNDSVNTSLDLVMMTNGWRRFVWTELSQKTTQPVFYKDAAYITLSGKVTLRDSKKAFAEKQLLVMLIAADSTKSMQMTTTDKQGNFRLDSMLFFGKSRILFSDIRGKKSQYIDVTLSADSLTRSFALPVAAKFPYYTNVSSVINKEAKMADDYEFIQKAEGVLLQGVTIKTKRKKSPVEELEDKYVNGAFSTDANKTLDLVNNKEADTYQNIFDYLSTRVNGIQVINSDSGYEIYYRQGPSLSSMGNIPMTLYLDEIETDVSVIATIPPNQIALVKVFGNLVAAAGNGPGGVLAIYTKKGADMNDVIRYAADMIKYDGYSVVKEFYAPDYKVDKSAMSQADNRITLDWRPDIFINNINPKIPLVFYNNDRTKSFKVVVEGMTRDGKMLMLEKIIAPKGF